MRREHGVDALQRISWVLAILALVVAQPNLRALEIGRRHEVARLNRRLYGQIIDYTSHSGQDRRLWSCALGQKRDMYVYLPPGYDGSKSYPVMIWMHGVMEDEDAFIDNVVNDLDQAIACGDLPPLIVAAPDGSVNGKASWFSVGSFFINSDAGNFEDYIMQDVWPFLRSRYCIRPEREAHVLAGASMGGFAAFNLALKYPEQFKLVVGILPPLNLRWVDCHCRYMSKFDPCCWGWRTSIGSGREPVGRYLGGLITIRLRHVTDPLFHDRTEAIESMSRENPIELIERLQVPNGLLDMYIGYAGRDEFNIDAQVESFLYVARARGIDLTVDYDPRGHHTPRTGKRFFPSVVRWLAPRLAPVAACEEPSPPLTVPDAQASPAPQPR